MSVSQVITVPAALRDQFRELAYRVAKGDVAAEAELIRIEAKIAEAERREHRREAVEAEEQRRAVEAQQQALAAARAADERKRAKALKAREAAYRRVEDATEALVVAVSAALDAGSEARAAQLRLGFAPGRIPTSELADFIFWKLGRNGAGLTDCPPVLPQLWRRLVAEPLETASVSLTS